MLNKRAEERLTQDLGEISKFVWSNRILNHHDSDAPRIYVANPVNGANVEHATMRNTLAYDSFWRRAVIAYWLPIYIAEETKEFLGRADKIQDDLDGLRASIEDVRS